MIKFGVEKEPTIVSGEDGVQEKGSDAREKSGSGDPLLKIQRGTDDEGLDQGKGE